VAARRQRRGRRGGLATLLAYISIDSRTRLFVSVAERCTALGGEKRFFGPKTYIGPLIERGIKIGGRNFVD
jgi:hypothetical protein